MTRDDLPRTKIEAYATEHLAGVTVLAVTVAGHLDGGYVSSGVDLIEVALSDGARMRLVRKRTGRNEIHALRALRDIGLASHAVPHLVATGEDTAGPWVLMPYYEGRQPQTVPFDVFDMLAQVHVRYLGGTDMRLSGIVPIDAHWWRRMCIEVALPVIDRRHRTHPDPTLARAARALRDTRDDDHIVRAGEMLPSTLLHGDMHPGNVIVGPDGATVIDWGNARIGPAMLDIANIAEFGSPSYHRYLAACQRLTGQPPDPWHAEVGYQWARAQINTQYLGWVAQHRPPAALAHMLNERGQALRGLRDLLRRGP